MSDLIRVREIASKVHNRGGVCYLVGGFVRDQELGLESKDIDVEVHNLQAKEFEDILSEFGEVNLVGKSFGVYMLKGLNVDWSLPRSDRSIGAGHRDFKVTVDPHMGLRKALRRRDFTINAMAYNLKEENLEDPFRADIDIHDRVLRHVDPDTFREDPLRVLRGAQFCARFGLQPSRELVQLCVDMTDSYNSLPKERVFEELKKLLLKGVRPSLGLRFLASALWIQYWPEFSPASLEEVYEKIDVAAFRRSLVEDKHRLPYMLSVLLASSSEGEIRSFLSRLTNEESLIQEVILTVENCHFPFGCSSRSDEEFRRLEKKCDTVLVGWTACALGVEPKDDFEYESRMVKIGYVAKGKKPTVVTGKHLIERGMQPAPYFGSILETCENYFLKTGERDPYEIMGVIIDHKGQEENAVVVAEWDEEEEEFQNVPTGEEDV